MLGDVRRLHRTAVETTGCCKLRIDYPTPLGLETVRAGGTSAPVAGCTYRKVFMGVATVAVIGFAA